MTIGGTDDRRELACGDSTPAAAVGEAQGIGTLSGRVARLFDRDGFCQVAWLVHRRSRGGRRCDRPATAMA